MVRKRKCRNIFERDKVTEKRSGGVKSYVVDRRAYQRPGTEFLKFLMSTFFF